jgi:protein-S-isoprenylcysteine O-methyltransferase Ste14
MLIDHLIFFGCWIVYYGLHSTFASSWIKRKLSFNATVYRVLYSSFSTLGLVTILLFGASIYSPLFLPPNPITFGLGMFLAAYGIFIVKRAFRNYGFKAFIGLKKEDKPILKINGLQSKIRPPLYTGTLLLVTGYVLFNPLMVNLISLIAVLIYLPFGIRFEEKKLIQLFGAEYLNYKKSVPALIPRIDKKQ